MIKRLENIEALEILDIGDRIIGVKNAADDVPKYTVYGKHNGIYKCGHEWSLNITDYLLLRFSIDIPRQEEKSLLTTLSRINPKERFSRGRINLHEFPDDIDLYLVK
ncbi:MAG: hypothetical protein OEL87_02230 [Nanoarchaeota archaeon]|nr:hypothetical protein [Nanoarchaeota archaeon]